MATAEERAHANRLLDIHRQNLERLEIKKATFGIDVPQWVENSIEEERANIAALEPLARPQPSQKVQEFVNQTSGGQIDLMMLFMQGTQINARMTQAEEQNKQIIDEQSRASVWRMQTGETIDGLSQVVATLVQQVGTSEHRRQRGAWIYRLAILVIFVWIVLHQTGVW